MAQEWISIEESKPDSWLTVILRYDDGSVMNGYWSNESKAFYTDKGKMFPIKMKNVTHYCLIND